MQLHIIGSGTPHALPDRYGSAFALETGEGLVAVDCGPATTYKMAHTIILTHQSAGVAGRPGRMEQAIGTIAGSYGGRLVFGNELTTVEL